MYEMMVGQVPFINDDPAQIYRRILSGKFNFPLFFNRHAKMLIKKLLQADLTKRYGCLNDGVDDIKSCMFFKNFDWNALQARTMTPPIIPTVLSPTDSSNFDSYPDSIEKKSALPIILESGLPDPFALF